MDIHHKVYEIVSKYNESMLEEIGDQDGYYDPSIKFFLDLYYAQVDGELGKVEDIDWIYKGKEALTEVRAKLNRDNHPLGALKTKHKIELNHKLGQALIELKKLKYPNWKPLLER